MQITIIIKTSVTNHTDYYPWESQELAIRLVRNDDDKNTCT